MAFTDREDLNFIGQLFLIGANQTPFLNMIGGLNTGKTSRSFLHAIAQPYSLATASQPSISEADSVTSNVPTTIVRDQDTNTVQIFQKTVEVSHAKQSTVGEIGGISIIGDQPVQDEFAFQQQAQLRQISIDLEFSMLQGTFQAGVNIATPAKMRGLQNAIITNTVAAAGATLTKALVDSLLAQMAATGSPFENVVLFVNAFNKQKLTDAYAFAPEDRNVGGVNIKTIETDFGIVGVSFAPQMPTDELYAVEMTVCSPMFVPFAGQLMTFEMLAQVAASKKGQWYAQIGLDYGPEEYHGSITGLATS